MTARGAWSVRALSAADIPPLQAFYDANPAYNLLVGGRPPTDDEAQTDFHATPPDGWSFRRKLMLGVFGHATASASNEPAAARAPMLGCIDLIEGLFAPPIWHLGFFLIATELHGSGIAQQVLAGLEDFAKAHGAQWMRLHVVEGNVRGERFWLRRGDGPIARRHGIEIGLRRQTVRVLCKPLVDHLQPSDDLAMAPRDLPDTDCAEPDTTVTPTP